MNQVKNLLTYRYAEIIQDLTVQFCKTYLKPTSRTYDQMIQAARSGKQNIVEGVGQTQTSKKGEIKLLGVAKASIEELLSDYEDFLRQRGLEIYPKASAKVGEFRREGYALSDLSNLSDLGHLIRKPGLPSNPQDAANFLLTLCHIESYLLEKQITSLFHQFSQQGGITEQLYRSRHPNH